MLRAIRASAGGRLFRLLIGALILVSAAAQFALVPVMPVYARRFGLSGFEQGMVLGATGLATLVVSVPAGTLSDRFGARRITLAAGLLMALATAGQALAGDFPALLAARLAFGAGYGMVWTAGLCWLAGTDTTRVASPVAPSTIPCSNPDRPNRRAYTGMTGTKANWAAALTRIRAPISRRNSLPPAVVLVACSTISSSLVSDIGQFNMRDT